MGELSKFGVGVIAVTCYTRTVSIVCQSLMFSAYTKKKKKEVDYVIIFHMIRMSLAHAMTCMHVHTSLFVLVCMRLIVLTVRY